MFRHHPLQFNSLTILSAIIPLQDLPINRGFFFIAAIPFLVMNDFFSMGSFWSCAEYPNGNIKVPSELKPILQMPLYPGFNLHKCPQSGADQVFFVQLFHQITRANLGLEIM
jgi:hypothetical protein